MTVSNTMSYIKSLRKAASLCEPQLHFQYTTSGFARFNAFLMTRRPSSQAQCIVVGLHPFYTPGALIFSEHIGRILAAAHAFFLSEPAVVMQLRPLRGSNFCSLDQS